MKNILIILFLLLSNIGFTQSIFENSVNLYENQEYSESIAGFEKSLEFETDKEKRAEIYHYIGISYYMVGIYDKAIQNVSKNLELNKSMGNEKEVGDAYNNLGIIYEVQGENKLALKFFNKSLEYCEKLDDTLSIPASLNNIACVKINLNQNEDALVDLHRALKLNIQNDDKYGIMLNYRNIGNVYNNMEIMDMAIKYHKKSLEISKEMEDKESISAAYQTLGHDFIITGDYDSSIYYSNKSLEISKELGFLYYESTAYENMSISYENSGNYKKALSNYKEYSAIKDSLESEDNKRYSSYLEVKYETSEKEKQLLNMENDNKLKNIKIEEARTKNNLLVFIISIVLVSIILIVILYRKTKNSLRENIIISSELKNRNKDMTDSINYSKNIQTGILSSEDKFKKNVPNSFILFKPKDIVSGDFYWTLNEGNKQYFAAVDCTGHGVPGAMMSIIGHTGLTRSIRESSLESTSDILNELNLVVSNTFDKEQGIKDGMDLSLCMIDKDTNILKCSMANNPVYIVRDKNSKELKYPKVIFEDKILYKVKADKQYIGCGEVYQFTEHEIQLEEGDMIYIFSDGFADQFGGERGKKYKYGKFQKKLIEISDLKESFQKSILERELNDWKGDQEQIDDVLVIGVKA
ncbi:MAG: Photosystem I assembly protein Ycf3 [uncultured marine phage]|uniref:Photosystem I assembly protein Ycf3 n=1 Tax=uncultured marine phage TaxID=707152 RepID=A0A8D9FQB0_9VIRU|nr:MAG: Photosystem I assembly protein Ycf3 [uncultured marine phage]